MDLNQITIPCQDYEKSVAFYVRLGLRQIVDSPPRYARFETESGTTLSIHKVGPSISATGVVVYFEVAADEAELLLIEPQGTPNTGDEATATTKIRI